MGQVVPTIFGLLWPHLVGLEEDLPNTFERNAEEVLQGLVLGRIELPQIAGPALAWKDPAKEHHLDHIDKLDVLVDHALDAHLQRRQLVRRSPVQALFLPGGKPHWGPVFEFGSRRPGGVAGLYDLEPLLLPPFDGLHEGTFGP